MTKLLLALVFAIGACPAQAGEILPLSALHVSLGAIEGVAYFTREPDGFRVVTTLVDGSDGTPVRLVSTLADGQRVRLSIPREAGRSEEAIELVRTGDVLTVTDPFAPQTASIE